MYKPFKIIMLAIPLIEIVLFIIVGDLIGILPTLILVILTTMLGLALLREQNLIIMRKIHESFRNGQPAGINLIANSLIVLAGLLLIFPGFFTDIIGILCLIPYLRNKILQLLVATKIFTAQEKTTTINGQYWKEDDSLPKE